MFAPVRARSLNPLLASASDPASEHHRTRANLEPCHSCHGIVIGSVAILLGVALALSAFMRDLRSGGWSAGRRSIVVASAAIILTAASLVAVALGHDIVAASTFATRGDRGGLRPGEQREDRENDASFHEKLSALALFSRRRRRGGGSTRTQR
jgi:hypothetical protein